MNKMTSNACGCTHTHTHTHKLFTKQRKGGSLFITSSFYFGAKEEVGLKL